MLRKKEAAAAQTLTPCQIGSKGKKEEEEEKSICADPKAKQRSMHAVRCLRAAFSQNKKRKYERMFSLVRPSKL